MNKMWSSLKRGFTLVELLVVIAIIAILAALLFPAIQGALLRGKMINTMNNGRQLYLMIFSENTEREVQNLTALWPRYGTTSSTTNWSTSTDYFKFLVTGEVCKVEFGFFFAPGLQGGATNENTFSAANNAWVAVDSSSSEDSTPLFFTRNVAGLTAGGALETLPMRLTNEVLSYSTAGMVLINRGGAGAILKEKYMSRFNPNGGTGKLLIP